MGVALIKRARFVIAMRTLEIIINFAICNARKVVSVTSTIIGIDIRIIPSLLPAFVR